jgi:hypothetical protein
MSHEFAYRYEQSRCSTQLYRVSIPLSLICIFTASMGTSSLEKYLPLKLLSFQRPLRSE